MGRYSSSPAWLNTCTRSSAEKVQSQQRHTQCSQRPPGTPESSTHGSASREMAMLPVAPLASP
eukprot:10065332-Prorocentrum_lima.AAC.1